MRDVAVSSFPNLPSFERLDGDRSAIKGHELNLVGFPLVMDMHDDTHIPSLKAVCWNVFGQYNCRMFGNHVVPPRSGEL